MKILVQKFGGSSVATAESRERVADRITSAYEKGYSVVVVVSAIGRRPEPYATDTLIDTLAKVGGEVSLRDKDLLMSCGEIISMTVMSQTLRKRGYDTLPLTGFQAGIYTDNNFGEARILKIKPERIVEGLKSGKIVIVAGFQGITEDGDITTLGRGGSDTTAAALGVALKAEVVEIFTDVEGIMTADPRVVPDAKIMNSLTYREVCEMAHLGAKVIHPRAVEIAMESHIPLRILSSFTDGPGTLITDSREIDPLVKIKGDRIITGLAHIPNLSQVKIISKDDMNENGVGKLVFRSLADAGISVDLINLSPYEISFTIKESESSKAGEILGKIEGIDARIRNGFAKVSAVGAGMRGVPGVMAGIVEAINNAGVKIYQTADSHTSISCLIEQKDMEKAACALHEKFQLSE